MSNLTTEQQFQLVALSMTVKGMSRETLEEEMVDLFRLMMVKENAYKEFLRQSMGIA
jgi:Phycobilisome degradation protein nblA